MRREVDVSDVAHVVGGLDGPAGVATSAPPTSEAPSAGDASTPSLRLILVLGAMVAFGPLTIDLYLPALPDIERDLATTPAAVQLTLTATLVGLALGQIVVGPLSDAHGRRRPLIAGTAIHVVASLACLVAASIEVLGLLRVLQGVGAAATAVVTMAIVRDLYQGAAAAWLLSKLVLVLGVAPVLAPSLGGLVLRWTSWRGVFVILAFVGLGLMALARFALAETLPPERRRRAGLVPTARTYWRLLHDGPLVGLIVSAGFSMGALFSYVSGSSFVLQDQFDLSAQAFAVVFGLVAVFLIGGTQLSGRLLRSFTPYQLLVGASVAAAVGGLAMVATATVGSGGLAGLLVPLCLTMAAVGMAMPNAPAIALSRHGEAAGTTAALLGSARFAVGATVAPIVGLLGNDAQALSLVVAGCLLVSLAGLLVLAPKRLVAS